MSRKKRRHNNNGNNSSTVSAQPNSNRQHHQHNRQKQVASPNFRNGTPKPLSSAIPQPPPVALTNVGRSEMSSLKGSPKALMKYPKQATKSKPWWLRLFWPPSWFK